MLKTGSLTLSIQMSKRFTTSLVAIILLHCSVIVPAEAEANIVVVTHKDSPLTAMTKEEVVELFLGKHKTSQDIEVKPLDSKDRDLRDRFYTATANMSGMRIKAYWSRIVFSGQGRPPHEIPSTEADSWLTNDSGALTYLPMDQVTDDMKIIFRVP